MKQFNSVFSFQFEYFIHSIDFMIVLNGGTVLFTDSLSKIEATIVHHSEKKK